MINGILIGIFELVLFFSISKKIKNNYKQLITINNIPYYWFMFTILTMIWEISFIYQYDTVIQLSDEYIKHKEHVWTNEYNLSYILPWKLSNIFYAEYGAYADRQYMIKYNNWSWVIEGSHALMCGMGSFFGILNKINENESNYLILVSISMGSQLMNSFLYLSNYFIQINDPYNINYNSKIFPTGHLLYERPFMYVNLFWTFLPILVISSLLKNNKKNIYNQLKIIV